MKRRNFISGVTGLVAGVLGIGMTTAAGLSPTRNPKPCEVCGNDCLSDRLSLTPHQRKQLIKAIKLGYSKKLVIHEPIALDGFVDDIVPYNPR